MGPSRNNDKFILYPCGNLITRTTILKNIIITLKVEWNVNENILLGFIVYKQTIVLERKINFIFGTNFDINFLSIDVINKI